MVGCLDCTKPKKVNQIRGVQHSRKHSDEPGGCTTDLLTLFGWCRLVPLSKGRNKEFSMGTMLPARSVEHFGLRVTYDLNGELVGSPIKAGDFFMNALRAIILLSSVALFTGTSYVEASPPEQSSADRWLENLKKEVDSSQFSAYHKSIQQLADLIELNGVVREYVTQMIEQVPKKHRTFDTIDSLLKAMNLIIQRAPRYTDGGHFPMSTLFARMMYTPAGEAAFRNSDFNNAIRNVLKEWCHFLDSRASLDVINKKDGWLSPKSWKENGLADFVIPVPSDPHGGFKSFNAFFHREIKGERRPVAAPDDPKVIVSANDGTIYKIARGVKRQDKFWIKGQSHSLVNMLNGSRYVDRFVGGDVVQSFLSGNDYHRYHSPIDGTVREATVVDGLMFSELHSLGLDLSAGTLSQGYEAAVNTRGLLFIESDDPTIGMVCVIPIGITEISSISLTVKPDQKVKKGQEVGRFSYGGSTLCLVFQPGAINRYSVKKSNKTGDPDKGSKTKVNAKIAQAN